MLLRSILTAVLFLTLAGCQGFSVESAAPSNALWMITHRMCLPHYERTGSPTPCAKVDLAAGFVILKDIRGKSQHLLIPTARVTGIEDTSLRRDDVPNYFADAWAQRGYVSATLGKPLSDDELSLAINPKTDRSQNQLHIHMDCIASDVRQSLADNDDHITEQWSDWTWRGRVYRVRRLLASELPRSDPFKLIAAASPDASQHMGEQTIFLTAAKAPRPYLYIVTWAVRDYRVDGHGAETLQDHRCLLAANRPTVGDGSREHTDDRL